MLLHMLKRQNRKVKILAFVISVVSKLRKMWLLNNVPVKDSDVEGYVGFTYLITNLTNNRKYIGKKRLTKKVSKKPLKGKKRRRISRIESDWKDYWGSNDELLADIQKLGVDKFKREIVRLCKTLGECSYFEAKAQFETDCLMSDMYYNSWISCRIRKIHLKNV